MKRLSLDAKALPRARQLRRDATDAEKTLRRALRASFPQAHFRFQVPLGPYIVDFCSHAAKLIIEVDGGQHAEAADYDAKRTAFLESEGYKVLRFWNNDISNALEGVIGRVASALQLERAT